jgi:hypothetical protein
MLIKALMVLVAIFVFAVLQGCGAKGIDISEKWNDAGQLTERRVKTGGDIAAMQLALEMKEAKAKVIRATAHLDKDAQNTMMIRGDLWTDEMAAYIRGEIAEGEQLKSGTTGGIWGLVGLAGVYGAAKTIQNGQNQAGDDYQTGDIHVTKSDDPVGTEGSSSGYIGGQIVHVGPGSNVTDFGQLPQNNDKVIQQNFGPAATSNNDNNTDPNRIEDNDTVKDNKAGFGQ